MKLNSIYQLFAASVVLVISCTTAYAQQVSIPKCASEDTQGIMSPDYWAIWNDEEQKRIDNDIEKYRKADGSFTVGKVKKGTTVKVEQVTHEFIFGAHIFNYNQLGKKEYNDRYKDLFGGLFNSATVAFYWKTFETQPGRLRFNTEYWDTEEYWNKCENPTDQPHWRRPPTDDIIKFCKEKGIRVHGHPLVWGSRVSQHPEWLYDLMIPEERDLYQKYYVENPEKYKAMSTDEIYAMFPNFCDTVTKLMELRVRTLAEYYKGTIDSWDVVNESAVDYARGNFVKGQKVCKSKYGIMPAEYTYKYFKLATEVFPKEVKLNINDYHRKPAYAEQVKELMARGCKVDIMGVQMHLFKPKDCSRISEGAKIQTPQQVRQYLTWLSEPGLPLHMSEITISAPDKSAKGQMIQAIITRNLYRLWFSGEKVMGITWWNTVDGCGRKNEPTTSGIMARDMKEKPAYHALDELINKEWKTNVEVQPDKDGNISWRGFKGKYRITWISPKGKEMTEEVVLK